MQSIYHLLNINRAAVHQQPQGISTLTAFVCEQSVWGLVCTGSGSIRKENKVSTEHRVLLSFESRSGPRDSQQHCSSFVWLNQSNWSNWLQKSRLYVAANPSHVGAGQKQPAWRQNRWRGATGWLKTFCPICATLSTRGVLYMNISKKRKWRFDIKLKYFLYIQ